MQQVKFCEELFFHRPDTYIAKESCNPRTVNSTTLLNRVDKEKLKILILIILKKQFMSMSMQRPQGKIQTGCMRRIQ